MALSENIARYGLGLAVTAGILRQVEKRLGLHIWAIQTRPLYSDFQLPAAHKERFTFKRLSMSDALTASCDPNLHMSADFARQAIARGDICEGAFEGSNLVAYCWRTTTHACVTSDLWLRLHGRGIRYGYKAFVLPEYRGIRLSGSNARFHDHLFIKDGINDDVGYIALHNLASIKNAYRDPNRNFIGLAGFLKFGGRYFTFRTPKVRTLLSIEIHRSAEAESNELPSL